MKPSNRKEKKTHFCVGMVSFKHQITKRLSTELPRFKTNSFSANRKLRRNHRSLSGLKQNVTIVITTLLETIAKKHRKYRPNGGIH